jgi:hypothetical protein
LTFENSGILLRGFFTPWILVSRLNRNNRLEPYGRVVAEFPCCSAYIMNECLSILARPLAHYVDRDKLCGSIQRDENPSVSMFRRIAFSYVSRLLADERP